MSHADREPSWDDIARALRQIEQTEPFKGRGISFLDDRAEQASDSWYVPYLATDLPESPREFEELVKQIEERLEREIGAFVTLYLSPDAHAA